MKTRYMFDGVPPSQERDGDAAQEKPYDMGRIPSDFVRRPSAAERPVAHASDEQIGVALDERSFESLKRIARYLGIDGAQNYSRAELLSLIREALL